MGVDLKLLVVDGDMGNSAFAHTMLEFGRNYDAHDKIREQSHPIPWKDFSSYVSRVPDGSMKGETCYGDVNEDCYGEKLKYVRADDFLKAVKSFLPNLSHRQMAAYVYLEAMPPETKIVLYWH